MDEVHKASDSECYTPSSEPLDFTSRNMKSLLPQKLLALHCVSATLPQVTLMTKRSITVHIIADCLLYLTLSSLLFLLQITKTKTQLRGLSPRANYTDLTTAACRRS
jgi:hypothetical protein